MSRCYCVLICVDVWRFRSMGRAGRVTTLVGPDSEKRIADTLAQLTADDAFDPVFSRRRSYRKSQKKRLERLELQQFESAAQREAAESPDGADACSAPAAASASA